MRTLLAIAIGAALVLGYGYYHAATHGWLCVNLFDTSVKPYAGNIRGAEIRLLDGNGNLLAAAQSDQQYGVVRLIHPQAGDCAATEQNASAWSAARDEWQKCFQTLSTWMIGWADRVRFADVKFADCDLKRVPVILRESGDDWWLWWVPLAHIGGKPLTYFNVSININGANCTAAPIQSANHASKIVLVITSLLLAKQMAS